MVGCGRFRRSLELERYTPMGLVSGILSLAGRLSHSHVLTLNFISVCMAHRVLKFRNLGIAIL